MGMDLRTPERTIAPRRPSEPADTLPYMPQMDALRALAAMSVLLSHYVPASEMIGLSAAMGVRLFFVISGFLITTILLRLRNAVDAGQSVTFSLRQFYVRRFLRIFPLYYLVVLLAVALNISDVREGVWWYMSYAVNYRVYLAGDWGGLSHFWSLAVEEQFYLFWPLVILLVRRAQLLFVLTSAILIGPISRAILWFLHANAVQLEVVPPSCLDALGLGALLAVSSEMRLEGVKTRLVRAGLWLGIPGLAALKLCNAFGKFGGAYAIFFDFFLALSSLSLVAGACRRVRGTVGQVLEWRVLRFVGTISYGIYVYHYVVGEVVGWSRRDDPIAVMGMTVATFAIASLSWFFYERPINEWKHRFPYRRLG